MGPPTTSTLQFFLTSVSSVSSLTTSCTDNTTTADPLAMTEFLTLIASDWIWNVYVDWFFQVTDFDNFRRSGFIERKNKCVADGAIF